MVDSFATLQEEKGSTPHTHEYARKRARDGFPLLCRVSCVYSLNALQVKTYSIHNIHTHTSGRIKQT